MGIRNRLRAVRSAPARLSALGAGQEALNAGQQELERGLAELGAQQAATSAALDRQFEVLRAIYDDEPGNRRRLWALREDPEYRHPFEEPDPLVTVFITTYSNAEALAARSIPSVLAQTHSNLELLVVGDAATPAVEEAAKSFDDPRVKFINLTVRGPYPDDERLLWLVAGTAPANEGLRAARGQWIAPHNDDDAFTPDHVEVLLREARRRELEFVYGRIRHLLPGGEEVLHGVFPPALHEFGVQASLVHRGLRFLSWELMDAAFGVPGDWSWVRRMMRIGVRIGMVADNVVDYYPAKRWNEGPG